MASTTSDSVAAGSTEGMSSGMYSICDPGLKRKPVWFSTTTSTHGRGRYIGGALRGRVDERRRLIVMTWGALSPQDPTSICEACRPSAGHGIARMGMGSDVAGC